MADITTAIISGSFAVAGCFGSVLLRAYLERRGQGRVSQPAPSDRTARLRPLFIAFIGFAAGIASCLLAPMFFPQPFYGVEMVLFCILLLVVLFAIIHHGRSSLARGLVIYQLEVLSLWAAFAFGGSLAHGFIMPWRDYFEDALAGWIVSEVAGLFLI